MAEHKVNKWTGKETGCRFANCDGCAWNMHSFDHEHVDRLARMHMEFGNNRPKSNHTFNVSVSQTITYGGKFTRAEVEELLSEYYGAGDPTLESMSDTEIAALLKEAAESNELDIIDSLDEHDNSGTQNVTVK